MLICNHISNVDGAIAPVKEIGRLCRERGIYYIVDASQSLGHLPLSAEEMGADVLCGPGHKGLFGIQGCGFAWLRTSDGLRECFSGGSGSASRLPQMPDTLPDRMEAGTLPTPAILALGAGIDFLHRVTVEAVKEHEERLALHLCDRLSARKDIRILRGGCAGVLSLCTEIPSPDVLTAALDGRGICVRGGLHCAPLAHAALGTIESGTVRISFSYFNTCKEIDRFAKEFFSCLT